MNQSACVTFGQAVRAVADDGGEGRQGVCEGVGGTLGCPGVGGALGGLQALEQEATQRRQVLLGHLEGEEGGDAG